MVPAPAPPCLRLLPPRRQATLGTPPKDSQGGWWWYPGPRSRPAAFRVALSFRPQHGLILLDPIRALDRVRLVKHLGALRLQTLAHTLQTLQAMFAP